MMAVQPFNVVRIDHVVIRADDLQRLIDFYTAVLGCPLEKGPGDIGLAQLRAGDSLIDIVDAKGPIGLQGGDAPAHGAPNVDHVCLQIDPWDVDAIVSHLRDHDIEAGEVVTRYGAQGNGPSMYIRDPEGNSIELKGPVTES